MDRATDDQLGALFRSKYGTGTAAGWSPRLRWRFGYFTPDDVYETTVSSLVGQETRWLDVGCGRDLFPGNPELAKRLASQCHLLVGVDPSPNVLENPVLHRAHQGSIETFDTEDRFDLVTLRMVAEHISDPERSVSAIVKLLRPGGRVVIYTVNRLAPVTLASTLIPFRFHHAIKHVLWKTEEKDTFPVAYRMNTRRALKRLFLAQGCTEESFRYLDDCRTLARWRWTSFLELSCWRALSAVGLPYPETCLLGIYLKT